MSAENSPTAENEALLTRVGAIRQEVAAMKAAMRRASRTRLRLLVPAIAILAAMSYLVVMAPAPSFVLFRLFLIFSSPSAIIVP